jgi:hypothetical protein
MGSLSCLPTMVLKLGNNSVWSFIKKNKCMVGFVLRHKTPWRLLLFLANRQYSRSAHILDMGLRGEVRAARCWGTTILRLMVILWSLSRCMDASCI